MLMIVMSASIESSFMIKSFHILKCILQTVVICTAIWLLWKQKKMTCLNFIKAELAWHDKWA